MKYFISFLLILMTLSCKNTTKQSSVIGTWSKCSKEGIYTEYIIADNYMIMLDEDSENLYTANSKFEDNYLIWSSMEPEKYSSFTKADTFDIMKKSKNELTLRYRHLKTDLVLAKITDDIIKIDSSNIEDWKKETISEFIKRAKTKNCPDLRTDEEKTLHNLDVDFEEEEDIIIPTQLSKEN